MSDHPTDHPLTALLLAVAGAAPHPWDYRQYAAEHGYDPGLVAEQLEWLWLEGLIQKAPAGRPPSEVTLTERGAAVAADPDALDRLRTGEVVVPDDPGGIVRASLRRPVTPWATRALLIANLAVFGYCLYLARADEAMLQGYLAGRSSEKIIERVLHPAGSVSALDLLNGQWWRMLTACFVHGGLLHLGMNMYALYAAGRFVEQTWGRWRYLLIYLLAGWGGSCMALACQPTRDLQVVITVVGASGALCGVLATEAVWVTLYSRYLPRALAGRGRSQMIQTVVLMVVISLVPGVSGWGHLGGALAGGAAAVALHLGRFGRGPLRLLAWPLLAAIPVASYAYLDYSRATTLPWRTLEQRVFFGTFGDPVNRAMWQTLKLCETQVQDLRDIHPTRRPVDKVKATVEALEAERHSADDLLARIERTRLLRGETDGMKPQAAAALRATRDLCDQAITYLRAEPSARKAEDRKLVEQFQTVGDLQEEWVKHGRPK
ncbi:MAG: rhomboid family intramembrane serine protease [Gemmataceae bacterium]